MAGLFRVSKPVVIPPPAPQPTPTETATVAATSHDVGAESVRVESRARASGGIAGTVATSARGVLADTPFAATRKSLLGE